MNEFITVCLTIVLCVISLCVCWIMNAIYRHKVRAKNIKRMKDMKTIE